MDYIITGAERSGTTMIAKIYKTLLEPKETIAEYAFYMELRKWKDYSFDANIFASKLSEKHSLNSDQNIYLLEFLKLKFPEHKFIYMIRDGRDVVKSMYLKQWGARLRTGEINARPIQECVDQWNTVIDKTYHWAEKNAIIVRYEDCDGRNKTESYTDVFTNSQIEFIENQIGYNLRRLGYNLTVK